jgi:hypothetical protein
MPTIDIGARGNWLTKLSHFHIVDDIAVIELEV